MEARYPVTISWTDFVHEFREQYPIPRLRDQRIVEFYQLTQDTRSVADYDAELQRLFHFLPECDRTESLLAYRFEDGLSIDVRVVMGTTTPRTYEALVTAAIKAERIITQLRAERDRDQSDRARHLMSPSRSEQ